VCCSFQLLLCFSNCVAPSNCFCAIKFCMSTLFLQNFTPCFPSNIVLIPFGVWFPHLHLYLSQRLLHQRASEEILAIVIQVCGTWCRMTIWLFVVVLFLDIASNYNNLNLYMTNDLLAFDKSSDCKLKRNYCNSMVFIPNGEGNILQLRLTDVMLTPNEWLS